MYSKSRFQVTRWRTSLLLYSRTCPSQPLSSLSWGARMHPVVHERRRQRFNSFSSSSSSLTADDADSRIMSRIGLGCHQWAKLDPHVYNQVVRTALENRIDTIEAGQEGGALALAQAYQAALKENPELERNAITFMVRIGYRKAIIDDAVGADDGSIVPVSLPNDVKVEEFKFDPTSPFGMAPAAVQSQDNLQTARVLHNISGDAVAHALESCPLVDLARHHSQVRILFMLHNPEVQGSQLGAPMLERQDRIRDMLVQGFDALQDYCSEAASSTTHSLTGIRHAFGVVSNGICLPADHPLYLNYQTMLQAVTASSSNKSHFSVLQVPANVLERRGFDVASAANREWENIMSENHHYQPLQIYGMRPLTCYPDLGTGTGRPVLLADHLLPVSDEQAASSTSMPETTFAWTNEMTTPPPNYHTAFRTALSHFDAEELTQRKVSGQELSDEERETLEGCQLLQSLLQDLDTSLDRVRSLAAHQDELYQRVIPLIHDTFEGLDDETAAILENYFHAYSLAVRFAIAKNTRKLLVNGEPGSGSNAPKCMDLAPSMRLQEYGLRFVVKRNDGVMDKVIVGSSSPEQVVDNIQTLYKTVEEGDFDENGP